MRQTGTIIDLVQPEPTGEEKYIELAKNAPSPKDNSFLNSVADYAKTALKGTVEGISRLGTMMGPTYDMPSFENGQMKLPRSKEEQLQQQTDTLDTLLPTDESGIQKGIRRGLNQAPSMMAFPGGGPAQSAARSMMAGAAGQTAEELGLPEWAQSAAELTAFIGPDVTKKLLSSGKDADLISAAKKMGMTDAEITPLIQSEFKQKWLSKLSTKRGSTQKALKSTKESLGEVYSSLQNSEVAKTVLPQNAQKDLFGKLTKLVEDMPSSVRDVIKQDAKDLASKPITGESLINFYKDINHNLSGNAKQLANMKQPIRDALHAISPEFGKDFENLNKLYTKYYPIAERLKPNLVSDLISAASVINLVGGVTMGYTPSVAAFVGEKVAKKLAQQMLINPHLQQLSKKMVDAMNANKYGIVNKLTQAFSAQLKDEVPEVSEILDTLTEEEIKQFFSKSRESEEQ